MIPSGILIGNFPLERDGTFVLVAFSLGHLRFADHLHPAAHNGDYDQSDPAAPSPVYWVRLV